MQLLNCTRARDDNQVGCTTKMSYPQEKKLLERDILSCDVNDGYFSLTQTCGRYHPSTKNISSLQHSSLSIINLVTRRKNNNLVEQKLLQSMYHLCFGMLHWR